MTADEFKLWLEVSVPILDRCLIVIMLGGMAWMGWRVPWGTFFAWLSAPSVGSLIFVCAFCLSAQSMVSQDSAYKYWNPYLLEFAKFIFGTFGNAFMALKAYRMVPEPPKPTESKTP